jgi:hypothetical protein
MAHPWLLIQLTTEAVPSEAGTNFGPPPWGLLTYGTDSDYVPPESPVEVRTGGASYLTQEEWRRLAKQEREKERKRREDDKALTETIREAYAESKNPGLKARVEASIKAAVAEMEDEEALITMIMHHYRKLH